MEKEEVKTNDDSINFIEVVKVLFSRKLLLLIVTLGVAFVGSIGGFIYNSINKSFKTNFSFSEQQLNGNVDNVEEKDRVEGKEYKDYATYLNDTRFEIRDYFSEEALKSYKENDGVLADISIDKIITKNAIEEAQWKTVEEYNKDSNTTKVLSQNYEVVFKKTQISFEEAKAIIKNATNKVVSDNISLLKEIDRKEYLSLYESALMFEDKVDALNKEFDYLLERYDVLIKRFGNVFALNDGSRKLISDNKNEVSGEYQNTSFDGYLKEINNKALIYNKEETLVLLESQVNDLEIELRYATNEKSDLISQRNAIISASDGKLTLDLESYNSKIVQLTEKIYSLEKEKEIVSKKISIINTTSPTVKAENEAYVAEFSAKLEALANKLNTYADNLASIEVYQYQTNMKVYFANSAILETVNKIEIVNFALISLVLGFVAALVTNLCLDGKKLTKEYKKEHENK